LNTCGILESWNIFKYLRNLIYNQGVMERLYKVSDVARMLNVSAVAVRKWIKSGKLGAKRVADLLPALKGEAFGCKRSQKFKEIKKVVEEVVSNTN